LGRALNSAIGPLTAEPSPGWRNAPAIDGFAIEARDGRAGAVKDFLFDDESWAIRWLVVDTGDWPPGREVLLPVSALGQPNRKQRVSPPH
jgi:hypothetical protein